MESHRVSHPLYLSNNLWLLQGKHSCEKTYQDVSQQKVIQSPAKSLI